MKLDYRNTTVTNQDYRDQGLTEEGIKRARFLESRVRDILSSTVETHGSDELSPLELTSFVETCVRAVGLSREVVIGWNKEHWR